MVDFRLRFNLAESHRIGSDAEIIELMDTPSGQALYLTSGGRGTPIKEHARAAIRGGPFNSEQDAREAAERAGKALLFWAVEQRVGIDFGDGIQRGIATNESLKLLEQQHGVPIRNDVHGIDVFEPLTGLSFVHTSVKAQVGKNVETLVSTFCREFMLGRRVTEKQVLASEIYANSFFDISQRSRFITLVTAVEALLELAERPDSTQSLVTNFIAQTQSAPIDQVTKNSIRGSLEWLRKESISQAGRNLANSLLPKTNYEGKPAGNFFAFCYEQRSRLLHRGETEEGIDVSQLASAMEAFVANLLIASLTTGVPQRF